MFLVCAAQYIFCFFSFAFFSAPLCSNLLTLVWSCFHCFCHFNCFLSLFFYLTCLNNASVVATDVGWCFCNCCCCCYCLMFIGLLLIYNAFVVAIIIIRIYYDDLILRWNLRHFMSLFSRQTFFMFLSANFLFVLLLLVYIIQLQSISPVMPFK